MQTLNLTISHNCSHEVSKWVEWCLSSKYTATLAKGDKRLKRAGHNSGCFADNSDELHLFGETSSKDSESLTLFPKTGLLRADLEVLSHQIHLGLGPNPSVEEHCWMFYTLANAHLKSSPERGSHRPLISSAPYWYFLCSSRILSFLPVWPWKNGSSLCVPIFLNLPL
jgi:hypothetical protein